MTMRIILPVLIALLVISSAACAQDEPQGEGSMLEDIAIDIVAGGGVEQVQIAVPDTYNLGDSDPEGYQDMVADTIRRCLEIAGYFEVLGPETYFFDPDREGMTESLINFQNWYNVGASGLIKTSIRVATAQVALDFRLYNVDTGTEIDIGYAPVTVPLGDDVRDEVYTFINLVIEYYTGSPGIFGGSIAFVARDEYMNKQIFVTSVDGSQMGSVTDEPTINILPTIGPDGSIYYTSYQAGNPDLYRNGERFSSRPGVNSGAAVSPDGSEVAVTLSMNDNTEIYILDTAGDILRRCTTNAFEDVSPTWSPSGEEIAFVSDRSGGPQIYVMNRDCSGQRRVTFAGNYNTTPDWSPQGDRIAFTGRDMRNRFDIFTVDPASGYIERLTQDQGNNEEPSWSPDGRYLVFSSDRGGGGKRLYIMTADGMFQTCITPDGEGFEQPAWAR